MNLPLKPAPAPATKTVPVEVEWHPDYRGGNWADRIRDDMGELTVIPVPVGPAGVTDALVNAAFQAQLQRDPACIIRWVDDPDLVDYDPDGEIHQAALSNGRP